MTDTASKDVLQKSGLSSTTPTAGALRTSGRLVVSGDVTALVVVAVGVLVLGLTGVMVTAVTLVAGLGNSGLDVVGLYAGMSPQILSFFEPMRVNVSIHKSTGIIEGQLFIIFNFSHWNGFKKRFSF